MRIPFTPEQFLHVFRQYNEAVWPAQWLLYGAGMAAVVLAFSGSRHAGRVISAILAALWMWMGIVYHLVFFRPINPAAVIFGGAFLAQAALFVWLGVWRGRLAFGLNRGTSSVLAGILVLYSLVLYPMLGRALGHVYPATPTFGLPCPTTILTLGLLLWATPSRPRALFAIPLLWTAVGTSAAVQLGMVEDFGLLVAGIVTLIVLVSGALPDRRSVPRTA